MPAPPDPERDDGSASSCDSGADDTTSLLPGSTGAPKQPAAAEPVPLARKVVAIISWFALNIAIASVNKWVISVDRFEYPAVLTVVHMACSYVLSVLSLTTCLPPANPTQPNAETLRKVRTLSVAFCASVFCGNLALKYVWVSFQQMVTAASPLMTLLLAKLLTDKQFSRLAHLSMLPMCGGVMLCVVGELHVASNRPFSWLGLGLIVASTALRGVKSIMQGSLLTDPSDKLDALTLLRHMSRYSIFMLTAYALLAGEASALWADERVQRPHVGVAVLASGAIAFLLNVCNFLVTQYTSAVTLQVLGNVKVVISIAISLLIFGNALSPWSAVGCAITLGGVWLYERGRR
jgi:drug/metabolite transporter (DMT)-like permease